MKLQLRPYQIEGIQQLSEGFASGYSSQIFQLATGGGKTITFSAIASRFIQKSSRKVVIAVNREELLVQARQTLLKWFGIVAEVVAAGKRNIDFNAQVFVTMVETANRRLARKSDFFGDVGLLIIDECHLGNFSKLYCHFDNSLRIGVTATPISSSKKRPLKNEWESIVCGINISDLIASGNLMPNKTYHVKNMNRDSLKVSKGDFNERLMGNEFSTGKHIQNCFKAYQQFCNNEKTLVFNCNVDHSKLVNEYFSNKGVKSKHLDGSMPKKERREILQWFANTTDAVLNNVGVLTTGFDEPSIRNIIVNKSTMSLPLWLQMTGRGSRPAPGKEYFTIVDLGGNALVHGDWSDVRDWEAIFKDPVKSNSSSELGIAPTKDCPECQAIIHASASHCKHCGYKYESTIEYDKEELSFEVFVNNINVKDRIAYNEKNGNNEYATIHSIKATFIKEVRAQVDEMTDSIAYELLDAYLIKVAEWCKLRGKKFDEFHKRTPTDWLFKELKKYYGWEPQKLQLVL